MNSSPAANSSISTTAVAGGGSTNAAMSVNDFRFPTNLMSIPGRKDVTMTALKSNIMAALNKEVKSLDDDNWMFEGHRSRINLMPRKGGPFLNTEEERRWWVRLIRMTRDLQHGGIL